MTITEDILRFQPAGTREFIRTENRKLPDVIGRPQQLGRPVRLEFGIATHAVCIVERRAELTGSWTVEFDPRWGGPAAAQFDPLISWPARPEPGIRHYSGTASYRKSFDLPEGLRVGSRRWLDLGEVRELAEVRLNGRSLGVVWAPPFRVDISEAVKSRGNQLEFEVVNFWPNRIIGDQSLPAADRITRTNIRKLA